MKNLLDSLKHFCTLGSISYFSAVQNQLVNFSVGIVSAVVLPVTGFFVWSHSKKLREVSRIFGIRMPANHHKVRSTFVVFWPVLGFRHGSQINANVDFGKHTRYCFGDFGIVNIAIIWRHHGGIKTICITRFSH